MLDFISFLWLTVHNTYFYDKFYIGVKIYYLALNMKLSQNENIN